MIGCVRWIAECLCPHNDVTLERVLGCRIGLSFLTKVLVADVDPHLHEQAFESGQIPTTLFLASVWLIGVCIITMIYAAANGLHLPPAFGWLGAYTVHDLVFCYHAHWTVASHPPSSRSSSLNSHQVCFSCDVPFVPSWYVISWGTTGLGMYAVFCIVAVVVLQVAPPCMGFHSTADQICPA